MIALVNICHRDRAPRFDNAGFRILGVFPSVDSAKEYLVTNPCDVDVHAIAMGEWFVLASKKDTDEKALLDDLLRADADYRAAYLDCFIKQKDHNIPTSSLPRDESEMIPSKVTRGQTCREFTGGVRNQTFAIITILNDRAEKNASLQQPAIKIWSVHPDLGDANKEMGRLAKLDRNKTYDVVDLYVWIDPVHVDFSRVEERYHHDVLNEMYAYRNNEALAIQSLKNNNDLEMPASSNPLSIAKVVCSMDLVKESRTVASSA